MKFKKNKTGQSYSILGYREVQHTGHNSQRKGNMDYSTSWHQKQNSTLIRNTDPASSRILQFIFLHKNILLHKNTNFTHHLRGDALNTRKTYFPPPGNLYAQLAAQRGPQIEKPSPPPIHDSRWVCTRFAKS